MAVKGMERFLDYFSDSKESFVVIGGCACSQWCSESDVRYRSTQDIDMVLILESKTSDFFSKFWQFIRLGGYRLLKYPDDTSSMLFRFDKPHAGVDFPKKIELLTGLKDVAIPDDVTIVHLSPDDETYSLSAILLHSEYYELVQSQRCLSESGLPTVRPDLLILLKVKAHLNLLAEKEAGRFVSDHDLTKHRNDVFHLTYLLRDEYAGVLSLKVKQDLIAFLKKYSSSNPEWKSINASLKAFGLQELPAEVLLEMIRNYFKVGIEKP
jgi:hypothetical protein